MPQGIKDSNSYARSFPNYSDTPKSVLAALALSFAVRLAGMEGEGTIGNAERIIRAEWGDLHRAGIVPQRPR